MRPSPTTTTVTTMEASAPPPLTDEAVSRVVSSIVVAYLRAQGAKIDTIEPDASFVSLGLDSMDVVPVTRCVS